MEKIVLKGITWNHSRGITPLLALAQRYSELHPQVEIRWKKRSLQEFADYPIEDLTPDYDLLIIDHPWVGRAAATRCVLPLDEHFSADFFADQLFYTVGQSHSSYRYGGHQWALAVDAATPVASRRADLLPHEPQTWEEVLHLAHAGRVAVPAIPIDLLMNFYTFCLALGSEPFASSTEIVDEATGVQAIETMRELYSVVDPVMFECNPIMVAERMTSTNHYWYCPFAYGYSNYAREGYAPHVLSYGDVVMYRGQRLCTTLGGTGLAVSAFSRYREHALAFTQMAASAGVQRTLYVQHGGQPGHRQAWQDAMANQLAGNYFANTLPALDRAYMRPRYNGYLHFQDHAGIPLQQCLMHDGDAAQTLRTMNDLYTASLELHQKTTAA